jgi:hypothetical protein
LPIAEPMTVTTDYVLSAVAGALAAMLGTRDEGQSPRRWWAASFAAVSLAAMAGGTWHGWGRGMDAGPRAALWLATYALVGLGHLLILAGAVAAAARGRVRGLLLAAATLRYAVFVAAIARSADFRYVVYDYAGTLLGLLALAGWLARRGRPGASWIAAGVAVSLLGALVQRGRLAPAPAFNHNDLFHVVQAAGLWLYYRGGRLLQDAPRARHGGARGIMVAPPWEKR